MENLVTIHNNEGRAGTFLIAQGFNRRHEQVVRLIKKYQKGFEDLNTLNVVKIKTKGRDIEEYLLDEDQFFFLGTLFKNNDQVIKFKLRLVKEFKKCRKQLEKALSQKNDPIWNQARLTSKTLRLLETNAIQEFIIYAKEQGGTPAGCDMYYANLTNMTNGLLFICEGKFKNMRDVLTPEQLMTVGAAEQIIRKGIAEGMKNKMFYKDIYKDVKARVMAFAELTGQSKVIEDCLFLENKDK